MVGTTISPAIKKLFWDTNPDSLDVEKHERAIIERVINYGTLADWRWIVSCYSRNRVQATLHTRSLFARSNIREESRRLAELILQ